MNIFVGIMVFFALVGLVDLMFDGRLGVAQEFQTALRTMGGMALATVGFYSLGVTFIQKYTGQIAALGRVLPFDTSVIVGSLLPPDVGALPIAQKMAANPAIAVFAGAMISGSLGTTIGYQLPVFLSVVKKQEIADLMRGFIFGIMVIPVGLIPGGLLIGLPFGSIVLNMLPVLVICGLLVTSYSLFPETTISVLVLLGTLIKNLGYVLFVLASIGIFIPQYAVVDPQLVEEMLYGCLRMVIVACGGLVLSHIILRYCRGFLEKIGDTLGVNNESIMGLILSLPQSMAMLPLYSRMNRKGQILNAAFSVCGAYTLGGQMAYVSSLVTHSQSNAYLLSKLLGGLASLVLTLVMTRYIDPGEKLD